MSKVETLMEEIKSMTVLELSELVKALEEEFGVSAAAPMMAMAAAPAAGGAAAAEEKTEFEDVYKRQEYADPGNGFLLWRDRGG